MVDKEVPLIKAEKTLEKDVALDSEGFFVIEVRNKEIIVEIFPNASLGGDRDILEALSTETLEMSVAGTNILHWYTPEYTIMDGIFIFRDKKHLRAVWDGPIGDEIKKAAEDKTNIMTIATFYRSPRLVTSNKPIATLEDLKGLKLRLPEIKIWIEVWKGMFSSPAQCITVTDPLEHEIEL